MVEWFVCHFVSLYNATVFCLIIYQYRDPAHGQPGNGGSYLKQHPAVISLIVANVYSTLALSRITSLPARERNRHQNVHNNCNRNQNKANNYVHKGKYKVSIVVAVNVDETEVARVDLDEIALGQRQQRHDGGGNNNGDGRQHCQRMTLDRGVKVWMP